MIIKKSMLILIIAIVLLASVIYIASCGDTQNDEDQSWLRSTKSDMETIQIDLAAMLGEPPMDISKLDACDKLVKDSQDALRNNHMYSPTSSKFKKGQAEWDIILNDYMNAAQFKYIAVLKWNDPKAAYDSSVGEAHFEAQRSSEAKLVDAMQHSYILHDCIEGE